MKECQTNKVAQVEDFNLEHFVEVNELFGFNSQRMIHVKNPEFNLDDFMVCLSQQAKKQ
jgi:hypothetical protein